MDVKITLLNGELDEEVYLNQPRGFIMPGNENKVCELIKSLYRLKQAPKQWHQKFDEVVLSSGYLLNQADKCVDLIKEFLSSRFSVKDIGKADVILVSTPMDISEKLMPNNGQAVSQLEYSRVMPDVCHDFNTEDNSSTSGWVFLLGRGAISWASKKQTYITGSTMKSEFVALTAAGKEAKWLRNLM
ncbi:zinc finger, CCHC-type containing protein [Tanacetum coccineum]